jgi:hypothetical protein
MDLNVTQDVTFGVKGRKQTLRFTADVYNFTNMLNKNWGVYDVPTTTTPLTYVGLVGNKPSFSFPYYNATTKTPLQQSWKHDVTSMASRYQIQLGVRYIF